MPFEPMKDEITQHIRRASTQDGAAIANTYLRSTAKLGFLRRVHGPQSMWHHFTTLATRQEAWVAVVNQHITGFIALKPGWIEHLYIHPRFQGRGAGHALLTIAKERATSDLRLWTFRQNKAALAFYRRHGFELARQTDGRTNEERMPDCLMVWQGTASE
ncbi:MAG: GNAT family N-acetyltransferase [Parvibaculum sp.]